MIYEWRVYDIALGKRRQLNERFANHTVRLFEKHGMKVIGFWENQAGGKSNTLYYMLGFNDMKHYEDSWKSFSSDPEWQEVVRESEKDGPLQTGIHNMLLRPTSYSPLK
jgi:hypothetical protein